MEIFGEIHAALRTAANLIEEADGYWNKGNQDSLKAAMGQALDRIEAARREVETYYRFLAGPGG